jgi:hypothetical protein
VSIDYLHAGDAGYLDYSPGILGVAGAADCGAAGCTVLLTSTPRGGHDHFFRAISARGMAAADDMYAGFRWSSSMSPLADKRWLAEVERRGRSSSR